MHKLVVLLTAVVFLLYGLAFLVLPTYVLQLVTEGSVSSSSGIIDIRATYGGMSVGVGVILLLLTTQGVETLRVGVWSVFILMSGMAVGRVIGIVLDGEPNIVMYIYLGLEVAVSTFALFLLRKKI